MKKAVAVMADGYTVYFEVEQNVDLVAPQASTEGLAADAASDLAERLTKINATILGVCRTVHDKAYIALADAKPKEFEVEFGITLSGEAGVPLVTKGSAEAALKITARW